MKKGIFVLGLALIVCFSQVSLADDKEEPLDLSTLLKGITLKEGTFDLSTLTGSLQEKILSGMAAQAEKAGINPELFESLLGKPYRNHKAPVTANGFSSNPQNDRSLFPPASISKEELELRTCYKVAPFDPNLIFRIPQGPGNYDLFVYPIVYNKIVSTEVIWVHSLKGIVLDKTLERSFPAIRWIHMSERFGNEWQIARAARGYIRWMNVNACP